MAMFNFCFTLLTVVLLSGRWTLSSAQNDTTPSSFDNSTVTSQVQFNMTVTSQSNMTVTNSTPEAESNITNSTPQDQFNGTTMDPLLTTIFDNQTTTEGGMTQAETIVMWAGVAIGGLLIFVIFIYCVVTGCSTSPRYRPRKRPENPDARANMNRPRADGHRSPNLGNPGGRPGHNMGGKNGDRQPRWPDGSDIRTQSEGMSRTGSQTSHATSRNGSDKWNGDRGKHLPRIHIEKTREFPGRGMKREEFETRRYDWGKADLCNVNQQNVKVLREGRQYPLYSGRDRYDIMANGIKEEDEKIDYSSWEKKRGDVIAQLGHFGYPNGLRPEESDSKGPPMKRWFSEESIVDKQKPNPDWFNRSNMNYVSLQPENRHVPPKTHRKYANEGHQPRDVVSRFNTKWRSEDDLSQRSDNKQGLNAFNRNMYYASLQPGGKYPQNNNFSPGYENRKYNGQQFDIRNEQGQAWDSGYYGSHDTRVARKIGDKYNQADNHKYRQFDDSYAPRIRETPQLGIPNDYTEKKYRPFDVLNSDPSRGYW